MSPRFMNLSSPKRQLVTPDPDTNSYIPVEDKKWDEGVREILPVDILQFVTLTLHVENRGRGCLQAEVCE